MFNIRLVFCTFFVFIALSCCGDSGFDKETCKYTDDKGNAWDLTSLKQSEFWKVKDNSGDSGVFSMDYIFNFCEAPQSKCKGSNVGAFEALEVLGQMTETCEILGRLKDVETAPMDESDIYKGVKVTYGKGDLCSNSENSSENGSPRKINFIIQCASSQDANWEQSKINSNTVTKCNLEFKINSPAGCLGSSGFLGTIKSFIFYGLICLVLYFVAGIAYNMKVNGYQGFDAIPNLDFWQQFPSLFIQFCNQALEQIQYYGQMLIDRIQNKQSSGGLPSQSKSSRGGGGGYGGYAVI